MPIIRFNKNGKRENGQRKNFLKKQKKKINLAKWGQIYPLGGGLGGGGGYRVHSYGFLIPIVYKYFSLSTITFYSTNHFSCTH